MICVIGTRPEAIKFAPLVGELRTRGWADVSVLATAQHRELLDQVLTYFQIEPEYDLNVMKQGQGLGSVASEVVLGCTNLFVEQKPDLVLVQGDTTTAFSASLAAFYLGIPVGHVEAGLRTGNISSPFPEEANRVLLTRIATWHFAPTPIAEKNLLLEGVSQDAVVMTGNTVIDALLETSSTIETAPSEVRRVLVTLHRRENFGEPFERILEAIKTSAENHPEVQFVFPVHPNPNIRSAAGRVLNDVPNVLLSEPLNYEEFVREMKSCFFIITDSGGVQEEAPALRKPVLVLREDTERPEAIEAGVARLLGSDVGLIVKNVHDLLTDPENYKKMSSGASPYGDGKASKRIVDFLEKTYT